MFSLKGYRETLLIRGFFSSMEELTKHWRHLSLSEREGPGVCLKPEQAAPDCFLAAKFLTKRAFNFEAIANTFQPLWRSRNGFKIENLGDHTALFAFDNKLDVDKILSSEPWSFDKHLMALQRYDKDMTIHSMKFNMVNFWVQVHDIPIRFKTREVAEQICSSIGSIIHPPGVSDEIGGGFIRVRVSIDISQPLCRGRLITLDDGKEHWVAFKYERLPNLCYWCGRLTHDDKD